MNKIETFYHNGKEIDDIRKWCEDNDTKMIRIKAKRKDPVFGEEVYECEMPEIFFEQIRMTDGWNYTRI